ncbi:MAG: TonB-dependent receptor [Alcanivoracaceae bacterium]
MFAHPLRITGFALCFLSAFTSGYAEPMLDEVVISVSRITPVADRLPVGTVLMESDEILAIPADNLADILDTVGGVNASRFYGLSGAKTSVDFLGFGATGTQNTLILLNGRRLNDVDLAAVDFSAIPVGAIERIEILPASGAVLYGSGAVGGAINIVTRQGYENSAGLSVTGGSYSSAGVGGYGSYRSGHVSGIAALNGFRTEGFRDNNELRQGTAFSDWRYSLSDFKAAVTVLVDDQKVNLPGGRRFVPGVMDQINDDPRGATTPNDWADQQGLQVLPSLELNISEDLNVHLEGGWRIKRQQYFVDQGFGYTSYTEAETLHFSLNPRLTGIFDTAHISHYWIVGLDFNDSDFSRDVSLDESTFSQPIHKVGIVQRSTGVYLLDSITLTDSTLVTAGVRHELIYTKASHQYDPSAPTCPDPWCTDVEATPFDTRQDAEMWNLGVRQSIGSEFALFANVERNSRTASVDEFFELDPVFYTSSLDPLDVQKGKLYSAGASWQKGRQRSALTGWHGDFRNEIHYDVNAGESLNLDPTRRYGVSLNTRWELDPSLWLTINGSYQRARFRGGAYEGNELPLVPRQSGYARFDWLPLDTLSIALAQRYVGQRYMDNDQANDFGRRIPSYRRSDIEVEVRPTGAFRAKAGIYNLENKIVYDYAVRSTFTAGVFSAYPLPDRHFMLTLGLDW